MKPTLFSHGSAVIHLSLGSDPHRVPPIMIALTGDVVAVAEPAARCPEIHGKAAPPDRVVIEVDAVAEPEGLRALAEWLTAQGIEAPHPWGADAGQSLKTGDLPS